MKNHQSVRNAFKAEHARTCSCRAYREIFCQSRWLARGFTPQPSAKPTIIRSVLTFTRLHPSQTKQPPARVIVRCKLYCRCEVNPPRPATMKKAA